MRPHRWQPTRLSRPWDSPGKNTGVAGHFLLQCMKVKSESEVAQSCLILSDPMDCSLPGSSIHGICQARVLEWGAIAFSGKTGYLTSTVNWCNINYCFLLIQHAILYTKLPYIWGPMFWYFIQFYQFAQTSDKCIPSNHHSIFSKGKYSHFVFIQNCHGSSGPFPLYVNFRVSLPSSPESPMGMWTVILNWWIWE